MAMGRRMNYDPRGPQIRVNQRIRVPEVRVVDADGSNLGILATGDALQRARDKNLDLVEVNPKASPPVCKILDYGKYKYDEKKKQRETKRKQNIVEIKEVKLRPKTDDHDLDVKVRATRRFLESGNKVKVVCRFRGREITHPQRARMQLDFMASKVEDIANLEQPPGMEGRTMAMMVAPKPQLMQRVQAERAARDRAKEDDPSASDPEMASAPEASSIDNDDDE